MDPTITNYNQLRIGSRHVPQPELFNKQINLASQIVTQT